MNSTLTKEQREMRVGKFTGSEIHKLMGVKGLGKTGETYINEKAAEFLTGLPCKEEFTSAPTSWGTDHEKEAQMYFEAASGLKIAPCDTLDNGFIAGTPDGILTTGDCGFEIKCPYNSGNHLKNMLMETPVDLLDLRPEYYWQVLAYQWLTNLPNWKFCSYDPRFKEEKRMLILNVPWNQTRIDMLKNRVTEAKLMFDNIISKLNVK